MEKIKGLVKARIEQEAASLDKKIDSAAEITPEFIYECLFKNELGDGLLYTALQKGKFVFVPDHGWYRWNGVHWELDITGRSLAAVESVAITYESNAAKLMTQIQAILSNNPEEESPLS